MIPVLYTIGKFNVYSFGFFLMIAFILSTFIIWKYGRDELKEEEYLDAYLYSSIFGLISARACYIFLHFEEFNFNILRLIVVRETPGLSLTGGLLGGLIFLSWYVKTKKMRLSHILDIFSIAAALAISLGKIGEQLGGAGFGKETASFFGVKIVGLSNFRHPVELYEAGIFFILFILLSQFYKKTQTTEIQKMKFPKGFIFFIFSFSGCLIIFLLEFLKNYPVYLYGLSIRQIILLLVMLSLILPIIKKINIIKKLSNK